MTKKKVMILIKPSRLEPEEEKKMSLKLMMRRTQRS
jgi:hypothetical protein